MGTSGKTYCHYLVFQLPAKILRAHGLNFGHKVWVTLDRTIGQRYPSLYVDLTRDEDKAREIGLRLEGTTEADVSPWGTLLTHQNGEQRKKFIKDFNGKRWRRPATDENYEMISKLNTMLDEIDGCPMSEIESKARRFLLPNAIKGRSKATIT